MGSAGVPSFFDAVFRLVLAFLLVLPVGWEREGRSPSAGLRTYPLLSVCVCSFLLSAQMTLKDPGEEADVFYGVLVGLAFVGSGAIVKAPSGMNTAVSLWVAGAIGAGVAYGGALIAAALALLTLLALRLPPRLGWGT